ncbi:unnamed protein product [Enterobius vermicularis]|uniref:Uncharacterized protein n=1 Tax=Enterobius vermicularis TaxID=51028 RepID=A0A0N4VGV0_ENTVE|nr:unnamed protein product [Enterobius vermicularis]
MRLFAQNEMNHPPPAYTLTSPCLPPADTKHQPWPPEPPPAFDRLPPYPAGGDTVIRVLL